MSTLDIVLEVVGWVVALVNLLLIGAIALLLCGTIAAWIWQWIRARVGGRPALPAAAVRQPQATPGWRFQVRRAR